VRTRYRVDDDGELIQCVNPWLVGKGDRLPENRKGSEENRN
jgi:hypothetical protein